MIPTARYKELLPLRCGTKPFSVEWADGPMFSVSYRKPAKMIPSSAVIASSNRRTPWRCSSRIPKAIPPVMKPATSSGTPNSRLSPIAAPRNSATSVDIAITSAWTHIERLTHRGERARTSSGRLWSVAIPSLADRYWISIAIRFAASTTHSSR